MPAGTPPIVDQVVRHAETQPLALALTVHGGRPTDTYEYSYRELVSDARRLAKSLNLAGVRPGRVVAVDAPASYEAVVAFLATWMCRAAYLPLDHFAPAERNRVILADASPVLLLTTAETTGPALVGGTTVLDGRIVLHERAPAPASVEPGIAYVIYTSGTTGAPKGVPIGHTNLEALFHAASEHFALDPGDTWLVAHSLAFDFSIWELWGALRHGGTAVLPDRWTIRDPQALAALIRERAVSVLSQTPTAFGALAPALLAEGSLEGVRYVVFGGERLLPGFLAEFASRCPATLYNMYGITEVTVHATIRRLSADDIRTDESNIGALLAGFEGVLVDEFGADVSGSGAGELLLAGPQVTSGYLHREELTTERFTHRAGRRYYRSGDLVRRSATGDGSLVYLGRTDDQVQIRGHRIELGEIERAAQQLPQALTTHVVAVEVDGEQFLACAYISRDGEEIDRRVWVRHLRNLVPAYMIPTIFRAVSVFPRTINGKIDRKALACRLRQPAYHQTAAVSTNPT